MINTKNETFWLIIASGVVLCFGIGLLGFQFRIRPGHSLSPIGMALQQDSAQVLLILGGVLGIAWGVIHVKWMEIAGRLLEPPSFLGRVVSFSWFVWFLLPLYCRAITLDIYLELNPHLELLPFLVLFPGVGFITTGLVIFLRRKVNISK